MGATTDLRAEHRGVQRMLNILDAISDRVRQDELVAEEDLEDAIEFLRVFVDACHHAKEEELLFPAMRKAGLGESSGVIGRLVVEHERGRILVGRIAEETSRYASLDAHTELPEAIDEYVLLLSEHIAFEESECFTLADLGLSDEVQDQLAEGYDRIESDVVGEGRHEHFHALLDSLADIYL